MTSPGLISITGPPLCCTSPTLVVTISVYPSGCECQAVRASGENVTVAPPTRAGASPLNGDWIRTRLAKCSFDASAGSCVPACVIFNVEDSCAWAPTVRKHGRTRWARNRVAVNSAPTRIEPYLLGTRLIIRLSSVTSPGGMRACFAIEKFSAFLTRRPEQNFVHVDFTTARQSEVVSPLVKKR